MDFGQSKSGAGTAGGRFGLGAAGAVGPRQIQLAVKFYF